MVIIPSKNNGITLDLYIIRSENNEIIKNRLNAKFKATPNSEYERVVNSINFILFNAGRNFNELYDKFFKEEYATFYDYLEQEKGFDESFVEEIRNQMKPNESFWEVRISDYEGYNFSNLFDCFTWDNNLIEILNNALRECRDEN